MADKKETYAAKRRLTITGVGSLYPDTDENRKLGRQTTAELTAEQAAPFGKMLERVTTKPAHQASAVTK